MADAAAHEPAGLNARGVLWGGVAIVTGILLAATAAYFLWRLWSGPGSGPSASRPPQIAQPVLQAAPQDERAAYFAEKRKLLDSWEWIDRERGVARIPVQEAMRIMTAHGNNAGTDKAQAPPGKERR
ncbi:hypothetical protein [Noviherbaspirillum sp. UKPF54]|uniref:hypothetical protein n=1 Tax=Noviherbaspirillum sp. UKPF54 TaxID=2601898 RepID=UPI0011B12D62|nr:hypothetical protein [Noviherbaspirillum sp. UKPF54]QDZ27912.1 hypothetical protein FAY22_08085 [Noviherbaspirillum sp. UKPF54]